MLTFEAFLAEVLKIAPTLIAAGQELGSLVALALPVLRGPAEPTQADFDALLAFAKPYYDDLESDSA